MLLAISLEDRDSTLNLDLCFHGFFHDSIPATILILYMRLESNVWLTSVSSFCSAGNVEIREGFLVCWCNRFCHSPAEVSSGTVSSVLGNVFLSAMTVADRVRTDSGRRQKNLYFCVSPSSQSASGLVDSV